MRVLCKFAFAFFVHRNFDGSSLKCHHGYVDMYGFDAIAWLIFPSFVTGEIGRNIFAKAKFADHSFVGRQCRRRRHANRFASVRALFDASKRILAVTEPR